MGMSESERRLLLSGTLDTSGVGGGDHERLAEVAVAWNPDFEPVEPESAPKPEEKPAARKRTPAKKATEPQK